MPIHHDTKVLDQITDVVADADVMHRLAAFEKIRSILLSQPRSAPLVSGSPTTTVPGMLEIDHEGGVIYFHSADEELVRKHGVVTLLRICQLPHPIPRDRQLDITHMTGVDWA